MLDFFLGSNVNGSLFDKILISRCCDGAAGSYTLVELTLSPQGLFIFSLRFDYVLD